MTALLNESVEIIKTMGEAHEKQTEVIHNTVLINEEIVNNFQKTSEQFHAINAMAENNAKDTAEVAAQAGVNNNMVGKMTELLNADD